MSTQVFLKDKPEHLPTLARWFFQEWAYLYPERSLLDVESKLQEYLSKDRVPLSLILCEGPEVVATASLCAHDMETHMQYSPWLESVYVPVEKRRLGLGEKIVLAAMEHAKTMGIKTLYLYTPDQEHWYSRMGWKLLERTSYRNTMVSIMTHELS